MRRRVLLNVARRRAKRFPRGHYDSRTNTMLRAFGGRGYHLDVDRGRVWVCRKVTMTREDFDADPCFK